jgi:hypothetical protein
VDDQRWQGARIVNQCVGGERDLSFRVMGRALSLRPLLLPRVIILGAVCMQRESVRHVKRFDNAGRVA